eukprot:scaffold206979_cov46-Cyclotella_meneghiniana.AAC.1
MGVLQKGQRSGPGVKIIVPMQPLQIFLPQHGVYVRSSSPIGMQQMGHSSGDGGSAYNFLSNDSAALISPSVFCFVRCASLAPTFPAGSAISGVARTYRAIMLKRNND